MPIRLMYSVFSGKDGWVPGLSRPEHKDVPLGGHDMTGVNRILSGQATAIRPSLPVGLEVPDPSGNAPPSTPLRPDRFTQGQPWMNKATVSGGNRSWGAQAYADQQQAADDTKVDPTSEGAEDVVEQTSTTTAQKGPTGEALLPEELVQLQELQKIDQKVRSHEQAHMGAAGGLATSGISLSFKRGPDGQSYAVGGEVSIDTSRASTPRETVAKMMKVRAAALAPADPSAQDRKVAASASVVMGDARGELQMAQRSDPTQVVEQASQTIVQNKRGGGSESTPAPGIRGNYQAGQYQKTSGGGDLNVDM